MKTDREFDIARSDIDAENTRLIQEYLRSRRRVWDSTLVGLPKKPKRTVVQPVGVEPQEGEAHASTD